jgi:hypothetical protein
MSYCEGCLSYTGCYLIAYSCLFDFYNNEGQCPCSNCIVKCMCEVNCEDFNKFKVVSLNMGGRFVQ